MPAIGVVILFVQAVRASHRVSQVNLVNVTPTPRDVPCIGGVTALWVSTGIDGGTAVVLAHAAHRELVWDSSVVKAPGILRKEANSFLHICALVLIGGLWPNFDRLFHWRGIGRRRGLC